MKTEIISLDSLVLDSTVLRRVAGNLASGCVAVMPTETYYGLGTNAMSKTGVDKIYSLKRRDLSKPLPLVASDLEMVEDLAVDLSDMFYRLAGAFWPGPVTLILMSGTCVPDFVTGPGRTVAVRIPPLAAVRDLIRAVGHPLTATSANISGQKEITTAGQAAAVFNGQVEFVIDGGRTPGGKPSTIVNLTGGVPEIIREGKIPSEEVLRILSVRPV